MLWCRLDRNRNITKKDTEQLIRAIWSTKHEENEIAARRGNPPPSLHDHIFQHLRVRFGNFSQIIAEWGYNLMEGCRRYAEDADIELFKLVVSDEVGEEVVQVRARFKRHAIWFSWSVLKVSVVAFLLFFRTNSRLYLGSKID